MFQEHHTKMIRITVANMSFKGNDQIVIKFIDPCDMVAQMYFKPGSNPFDKHDFYEPIPNPVTRAKAVDDPNYRHCTIKESGLHTRAKPGWM